MKTSYYQKLRHLRAKNKGDNAKLARAMRKAADMLERKGTDDLTEIESIQLFSLEKYIGGRIDADTSTKKMAKLMRKIERRSKADRERLKARI